MILVSALYKGRQSQEDLTEHLFWVDSIQKLNEAQTILNKFTSDWRNTEYLGGNHKALKEKLYKTLHKTFPMIYIDTLRLIMESSDNDDFFVVYNDLQKWNG